MEVHLLYVLKKRIGTKSKIGLIEDNEALLQEDSVNNSAMWSWMQIY